MAEYGPPTTIAPTASSTGLASPGLAAAVADPAAPEKVTINYGDCTLTLADSKRLAFFLTDELTRSASDTSEFRQRCIDALNFVDPVPTPKSFPWQNAANFFIPIPRTVLDAFKSSFKMTVVKQREMFVAEVISAFYAGIPEGKEHDTQRAFAEACERLAIDPALLDLKAFFDKWLEEMLLTGIGPAKLVLEENSKVTTAKAPGDSTPKERRVVIRRGPRLYAVPVGSWEWPAGLWSSIQEMPWVGNWVELTASALRQRASDPSWGYNSEQVEKIIAGGSALASSQPDLAARLQKVGQQPSQGTYRLGEYYLDWDLYNDGKLHSVVVAFHLGTQRIARIRYTDGIKPYFVEVASPRSGTAFGRGIIEPIMQPCKAINEAVNQTFDSQTLANTPSLLYSEDSITAQILSQHGGFFPGIPLAYKESKDEVGILEFPNPSTTSFSMIQFFQSIIERLTRIGPTRLGEVSEGRRTPATLGLSTQQLGAELLDELIDRARDTVGHILERALVLAYQDDPTFFVTLLGPERGALVNAVLQKGITENRALQDSIRIRLSATSSTRSIELERQNAMATAQMTMGWYAQVIQLVQMYASVVDPTVRGILLHLLQASEEQMKRLAELANQPDVQLIIPQIAEMLASMQPPAPPMMPGGPGMAAPGGGQQPLPAGGTAPAQLPPNMAAVLQMLGGGGAPAR